MEWDEFQKIWKTFEIIGIISLLLIFLFFLYLVRELLTPFLVAFVITFFLNPLVNYVEGGGINRTLSVIVLIIMSAVILFILWKIIWPTLQGEVNNFIENFPLYIQKAQVGMKKLIDLLERNIGFIPQGTLEGILKQKVSSFTSGVGEIGSLIKIIKNLLTSFIIIPFIVFFFLKDGRRIKKMLISYVPNKYFETSLIILYKIEQQISNYIRGQLIDSCTIGLLAIGALYCVGINYAFLIGGVLGILNIVFYIGPFIGFVFGSLLVLFDTGLTTQLIKFIVVFVFVRLIDDTIVAPLALSRSVHVHPLMVIILIILGGYIHGILGMLLAIPLYCSIKVTFQILYKGLVEYGNW